MLCCWCFCKMKGVLGCILFYDQGAFVLFNDSYSVVYLKCYLICFVLFNVLFFYHVYLYL